MKPSRIGAVVLGGLLATTGLLGCQDRDAKGGSQHANDNTGVNVRDRNPGAVVPTDQSESSADRELTQKIRQAIVGDDSLSTSAKNVKVITAGGTVTLRGPVKTEQERATIVAKARQIAGGHKVDNQLEIASD